MPSFIAFAMVIYFATIVDKATVHCKVNRQLTGAWDNVKTYPHRRPALVKVSCIVEVNIPYILLLIISILLKYQSNIYSTFDVP